MNPKFVQLNIGWNAQPNAPETEVHVEGSDVILRFQMNPYQFQDFHDEEQGFVRFVNCSQFRLGATNDEGWYLGQCRFSKIAPEWGEFYAILDEPRSVEGPEDWVLVPENPSITRTHFLFYFRDGTFECVAENCLIEPVANNALVRAKKSLPEI